MYSCLVNIIYPWSVIHLSLWYLKGIRYRIPILKFLDAPDLYIKWHGKGFPDSSVGKESACNAGEPGSSPGLGRSAGEGLGYPLQYSWASLVAQLVKKSACKAEDLDSIPGLERSPGEGNSYPFQYSGLENSTDCIDHGVTKVRTWLSNFQFFFNLLLNLCTILLKLCIISRLPIKPSNVNAMQTVVSMRQI